MSYFTWLCWSCLPLPLRSPGQYWPDVGHPPPPIDEPYRGPIPCGLCGKKALPADMRPCDPEQLARARATANPTEAP